MRSVSHNLTNQKGEATEITYLRDGKETTVTLTPRQLDGDPYPIFGFNGPSERTQTGIIGAVKYGAYTLKYWVDYTFECLRKCLLTGQVGIQQMSGPVGIVTVVDDAYKNSLPGGIEVVILNLMNICILITANFRDHEPASDTGAGRRKTCISDRGSGERKTGSAGKRGDGTFCGICPADGIDGCCDV